MRQFFRHVISPAIVIIDNKSIGYTEGESVLNHIIETITIPSKQSLLDAKAIKSYESGYITFNFPEMTLENLQLVYETSQDIEVVGSIEKLRVGGDSNISEHYIFLYSEAPNKKLRKTSLLRCVRDGEVGYPIRRGGKTIVSMKYKLLGDFSRPVGQQLFRVTDLTSIDYSIAYGLDFGL